MPPSGGRGGCGRGRYPCNLRNSTLWRLQRKGERVRGGAGRGGSPGFFTFGGPAAPGCARLLHIRRANLYRPARDTASAPNEYRADTNSGSECVSTCAGYRFGCERVARGHTFGVRTCIDQRGIQLRVRTCGEQIHIRRQNVYRRASRQATRYSPYLATACRMRAPHGTQIAARKPTVAAPCRQSHGRPAAYAATMAGQVMGST